MRTVGLREVKIAELRKPGNWKELLASPEVEVRARSIAGIGMIQEPVVRQSDKSIVCGRRRIAAKEKLGDKHVLVKLVECTDYEAEIWAAAENAERSHSHAEQRQALERLIELVAKEKADADKTLRFDGPGGTKSAIGLARDQVAAALGIKPKSIKQRRYRSRLKHATPAQLRNENLEVPEDDLNEGDPDPIVSPWAELDDIFKKQVRRVQKAIDFVDNQLIQGLGMLTKIKSQKLPCHADRIDKIHEDLAYLGAAVRGLLPAMLCPWCKGTDGVQERCVPCRGAGYITKSQVDGVPKELMGIKEPVVIVQGETKKLADYAAVELPTVEYNENPFGLPDD